MSKDYIHAVAVPDMQRKLRQRLATRSARNPHKNRYLCGGVWASSLATLCRNVMNITVGHGLGVPSPRHTLLPLSFSANEHKLGKRPFHKDKDIDREQRA